MKAVVDSSVIVKWLNSTDEENVRDANNLLSDALEGKVELLAPELAKYEVGNVLLKGKQLTPQQAYISLVTFHALPIEFVSETEDQAKDTYLLAYNNKITYYDAAFLTLAKEYDATLITENLKHQGKASNIKVTALKDY